MTDSFTVMGFEEPSLWELLAVPIRLKSDLLLDRCYAGGGKTLQLTERFF
jgi:hypothetical protein